MGFELKLVMIYIITYNLLIRKAILLIRYNIGIR